MASGSYMVDFDSTGFSNLGSYTFPTTQTQIRDNFSDMVPRTVRIPGADGGFDQFGEGKAPSEIGLVSITFEQYADSNEDLQTKRDLVRAMAAWGIGYLTKDCGAEGERYCIARVNSITMTESPSDPINNQKLTATVDFQVPDPYWLVDHAQASLTNITKTMATNSTPNAVLLDGIFDPYLEFQLSSTADVTDFAIGWTVGSGSMDFADCQFKIENLDGLGIRKVFIFCDVMSIRLQTALLVNSDGFAYTTWDYANFVKLPAGQTRYLYIYVVTAGTASATMVYSERY